MIHKHYHYQHEEIVSTVALVAGSLICHLRKYDKFEVLSAPHLHHHFSLYTEMADGQASNDKPEIRFESGKHLETNEEMQDYGDQIPQGVMC